MVEKGRTQKKPYCSPKITKVNLKSEEAVLSGCKTSDQGGATTFGSGFAPYCKYHNEICSQTLS